MAYRGAHGLKVLIRNKKEENRIDFYKSAILNSIFGTEYLQKGLDKTGKMCYDKSNNGAAPVPDERMSSYGSNKKDKKPCSDGS